MSPKITVIMPVYNGQEYLNEAVDSILAQSYSDFELIVLNDGSTDRTAEILASYNDPRLRVIGQENMGLIATLNKGIGLAQGEYIARMDADDWSHPDRFTRQVALLDQGYDICGCHYHVVDAAGRFRNSVIVPVTPDELDVTLCVMTPFAHGSVMFRKAFYTGNNLRYGSSFTMAEDYALWCEFYLKKASMTSVNGFMFHYREHGNSLSRTKMAKMLADVKQLRSMMLRVNKQRLPAVLTRVARSGCSELMQQLVTMTAVNLLLATGSTVIFSVMKFIPFRSKLLAFLKLAGRK